MQLQINSKKDIIFEWIPYNKFDNIKEINKDDFVTVYSALWKDGPLFNDYMGKRELIRESNKKVALKCICDSKNTIDEFLDEV